MKKLKKFFILLIVASIIVGAAAGGVYAYQKYQRENLQAEVVLVSNLNWGYYGDESSIGGSVSDDQAQSVYPGDKIIAEVKVAEGDEVSVGDPLLMYDTTDIQIQIDIKKLELQGTENDIAIAQRALEKLKKIIPTPTTPANPKPASPAPASPTPAQPSAGNKPKKDTIHVLLEVQKKDGKAYNYIDSTAKPYTGNGTLEKPYRFLCTQECYVLGSYLNELVDQELSASFEIWSGNSVKEGTLLSCWTVNGIDQKRVGHKTKWLVATQEKIENEILVEEETETESEEVTETESEEPDSEDSEEETYTAEELKKEIFDKESELTELTIEKKKADLEMEKLVKDQNAATVLASINGVVKFVGDPQNPPDDGSAFMELTSSKGMYVKGEISELMLDQFEVGQVISVSSWNTEQTYQAAITEISQYPANSMNDYGYGGGNPNTSYYPFTAYIENAEGLVNDDYVQIAMQTNVTEEEMNSLYIDKAYVREEHGQFYVLKAGEGDYLVKQYIKTGKKVYGGSAIEIKAGLSETDRIAFPYGKTAKEGIKVMDSEDY